MLGAVCRSLQPCCQAASPAAPSPAAILSRRRPGQAGQVPQTYVQYCSRGERPRASFVAAAVARRAQATAATSRVQAAAAPKRQVQAAEAPKPPEGSANWRTASLLVMLGAVARTLQTSEGQQTTDLFSAWCQQVASPFLEGSSSPDKEAWAVQLNSLVAEGQRVLIGGSSGSSSSSSSQSGGGSENEKSSSGRTTVTTTTTIRTTTTTTTITSSSSTTSSNSSSNSSTSSSSSTSISSLAYLAALPVTENTVLRVMGGTFEILMAYAFASNQEWTLPDNKQYTVQRVVLPGKLPSGPFFDAFWAAPATGCITTADAILAALMARDVGVDMAVFLQTAAGSRAALLLQCKMRSNFMVNTFWDKKNSSSTQQFDELVTSFYKKTSAEAGVSGSFDELWGLWVTNGKVAPKGFHRVDLARGERTVRRCYQLVGALTWQDLVANFGDQEVFQNIVKFAQQQNVRQQQEQHAGDAARSSSSSGGNLSPTTTNSSDSGSGSNLSTEDELFLERVQQLRRHMEVHGYARLPPFLKQWVKQQ